MALSEHPLSIVEASMATMTGDEQKNLESALRDQIRSPWLSPSSAADATTHMLRIASLHASRLVEGRTPFQEELIRTPKFLVILQRLAMTLDTSLAYPDRIHCQPFAKVGKYLFSVDADCIRVKLTNEDGSVDQQWEFTQTQTEEFLDKFAHVAVTGDSSHFQPTVNDNDQVS